MNPEERRLLAGVLAEPQLDEPRLIYADWMEEYGDPLRAEFIRLQIDLAKIPAKFSAKVSAKVSAKYLSGNDLLVRMVLREHLLLQHHGCRFLTESGISPFPGVLHMDSRTLIGQQLNNRDTWVRFDRGFPNRIWTPWKVFEEKARELVENCPLEWVNLVDRKPSVYESVGAFAWWKDRSGQSGIGDELPEPVWSLLEVIPSDTKGPWPWSSSKWYRSEEIANEAASRALLLWARAYQFPAREIGTAPLTSP